MKYLWLLLFSISIHTLNGQDSTIEKPLPAGQYLKSYFTNGVLLVASPLHWQKRDWLIAGSTVAVGTGLYLADREINKPMMRWQSSADGAFGKVGNALGPLPLIGSSLVVLGTGIVAREPSLTNFAQDNLQAQLYTGGICYFAKVFFGRRTPGNYKQYWAGPFQFTDSRYQSFFSGHSSIAFATATSIYLHSHRKWWVGVISYGVATGIGVSRMQRQVHWASDVFLGAVVGSAVSTFVFHQNQKRRKIVNVKNLP
jgi:membrane-associated phospholipid phosphatase